MATICMQLDFSTQSTNPANQLNVQERKPDDRLPQREIADRNEQPLDLIEELSPRMVGYYTGQYGRDEHPSKSLSARS